MVAAGIETEGVIIGLLPRLVRVGILATSSLSGADDRAERDTARWIVIAADQTGLG
jgi:hypothetical protein